MYETLAQILQLFKAGGWGEGTNKILNPVTFGRTSGNLKCFVMERVIYFHFDIMIGSL